MTDPKIILASTSKFRKTLLERLKIPFEAVSPNVFEDEHPDEAPKRMARRLARLKAEAVHAHDPNAIIIGSDQVPEFDGRVLRKPETEENARLQLRQMSGKSHLLHTACHVINGETGEAQSFVDTARLWMRQGLTDAQLSAYIRTDHPLFCAGGYMLEASGIALFSRIECSDWSAITGLPLIELTNVLINWGVALFSVD